MCTTEQKPQALGHQSDLCDSGDEKSRVRHNSQWVLGIYVGGDNKNKMIRITVRCLLVKILCSTKIN